MTIFFTKKLTWWWLLFVFLYLIKRAQSNHITVKSDIVSVISSWFTWTFPKPRCVFGFIAFSKRQRNKGYSEKTSSTALKMAQIVSSAKQRRLRKGIRSKRQGKPAKDVLFQKRNTSAHNALVSKPSLREFRFELVYHPTHS